MSDRRAAVDESGGGDRRAHWQSVWAEHAAESVSWYQVEPSVSLDLIARAGIGVDDAIVDIGGGASPLVARLAAGGYRDLTVLDIAAPALEALDRSWRADPAVPASAQVNLIEADVMSWQPQRSYRLWHDRAANHFLTDQADRARYAALVGGTVVPGGYVVLAEFAPDGPPTCSGLPVYRCSAGELAAELATNFDCIYETRELHRTPWHATQSFQYLLLRRR